MRVFHVFDLSGRFAPAPDEVLALLRGARRAVGRGGHLLEALGQLDQRQGLVAWHVRLGLARLCDAVSLPVWLERRERPDVLALLERALGLFVVRRRRVAGRGGWRVSRSPLHLAPEVALRPLKPLVLPVPATTPMPAQLWARPCRLCRRPTPPGMECVHGARGPVQPPAQKRRRRVA